MAYQPKSYKKFVATAATATLVATAIVPVASAADAKSFKDVSKTYQEAVNYLVTNDIAQGKSDTMFGTSATITRGDAAVMIAKALKLDTTKAPSAGFKDVNARVGGAVNALVAAKIVSGKTATTFAPDSNISRQEMAKIIANAYKLDAGTTKNKFNDVNKNWDGFVDALVANGITFGKNETTFAPTASVTRGEFALFVFRTENLTPPPVVVDPSNVSVVSVSAITLTDVTVTIDTPAVDLADAKVIVRDAAGKVVPTKLASVKAGAQEATFSFVNPITVSPTSKWTVNGVAYAPAKLEIVEVDSVTPNGKYLEVLFNKSLTSLEASEISIRNSNTLVRVGVESVKLASDGMSAQVTLLGSEDAASIIQRLTSYDFTLTQKGTVTSKQFTLPGYITERSVTAVDAKERTITVNGTTLKVPATMAFDFELALGQEIAVWFDKSNNVTKFNIVDHTVKYDAVKFEVRNGVTYAKLATEGKEYRLANNANLLVKSATGVTDTGIANNAVYASAKLVFNNQGQVQNIVAVQTFADALFVQSVEGNIVKANATEYNLKDYTVVKDGKTIALSDLKAGDVVFYNNTAKFAEVYTNQVSGKVEAVYKNEFKVNGKSYDYTGFFLAGGDYDALDSDALEAFKAADKPVTIHLNRAGDVALVTGTVGEVVSSTSISYLTKNAVPYKDKAKDYILLETVNAAGEKVEENVKVEALTSITAQGVLYKVGQDAYTLTSTSAPTKADPIVAFNLSNGNVLEYSVKSAPTTWIPVPDASTSLVVDSTDFAAEKMFVLTKDAAGNVIGLNQQEVANPSVSNVLTSAKTIDGRQVKSTTPVFIVNRTNGIKVSTKSWSQLDKGIVELNNLKVYGTAKDVSYLVIDEANIVQPNKAVTSEVVVEAVNYNVKGELAYLQVLQNGVSKTIEIDPSLSTTTPFTVGEVVSIKVLEANGKLSAITPVALDVTAGKINITDTGSVNTSNGTVKVNGVTYTKAASGVQIYEIVEVSGKKVAVARDFNYLSTLKADNELNVSFLNGNNKYFDTIVITKNKDVAGPGTPGAGAASFDLNDSTVLFADGTATTDTVTITASNALFAANAADFITVDGGSSVASYTVSRDNASTVTITFKKTAEKSTATAATITINKAAIVEGTASIVKNITIAPTDVVVLGAGSVAGAVNGNKEITGLTDLTKYVVTEGTNFYGVKADGTLATVKTTEAAAKLDAVALSGVTKITGLTNGKTYKVEVVTP